MTESTKLRHKSCDVLDHIQITKEKVLLFLEVNKMNTFLGPDQVHPKTLWEVKEEIAEALVEIFTSSLAWVVWLNDFYPMALMSTIMRCFEETGVGGY